MPEQYCVLGRAVRLEIKCSDQALAFSGIDTLIPEHVAEQADRLFATRAPKDLSAGGGVEGVGCLLQPTVEAFGPAIAGSQTKRLEKPAIAVVPLGQARPEFGCVGGVDIPERGGCLGQYSWRRVVGHVLDPLGQVVFFPAVELSRSTQGDHSDRCIRIIQRPVDEWLASALDATEQPKCAGTFVRFSDGVEGIKMRDRLHPHVVQRLPTEVACVEIRAFQRRYGTGTAFQIQRLVLLAMPCRGDAIDAAPFAVGLSIPADDRVVPIADEQRAVRRHCHVNRPKPLVAFAFHEVDHLARETAAVRLGRGRPNDTRPGVAVDHLIVKNFGEQFTLVNGDAGRGAGTGLDKVGHHAGVVLVPVP